MGGVWGQEGSNAILRLTFVVLRRIGEDMSKASLFSNFDVPAPAPVAEDWGGALVGWLANLHIAHWLADTQTNEHKTLGDLYESADGLVDEFVEVALGKQLTVPLSCKCSLGPVDPRKHLDEGLGLVERVRAKLKVGEDDDLLNLVADLSGAINRAKYLLK